jgi:manganese/zinc/iron transport system permease protein
MINYTTLIVLAGTSLLGACAGLVGGFAVLRRRALLGDAIAHAALPGVCLAFWFLGERNLPVMLTGAFLTGLLGIATVTALGHWTRIKEDAAIGVVLGVFYGVGIALSSYLQKQTTIGSKAGLESYILGKAAGMVIQDVVLIGIVSAFCLLLVILLYKEFKLVVFDPDFANTQGWPAFGLDLLLMTMIAITVVIGLPSVGVVLMAALLIIPAAAARFWTQKLEMMLVLSVAFGLVMGTLGTMLSANFYNLPAGPTIVLVGTGLFLVSLLFAPGRGAVARFFQDRRSKLLITSRALLRVMFDLNEPELPARRPIAVSKLIEAKSWSPSHVRRALSRLERNDVVVPASANSYCFTESGLHSASVTVLEHRLFELFLAENPDAAGRFADHDAADWSEQIPAELLDDLKAKLRAEGRLPMAAV